MFLRYIYPDILLQLEWLASLAWTPTTANSETLTRSDFLANSQSQLNLGHYSIEKVKRRLMGYPAIVRLPTSITYVSEVQQTKA
jgi:ATP-dependent Lon protease